jgi:hypothetical protein
MTRSRHEWTRAGVAATAPLLDSDTGRRGGSVVEDDGSFALFGACTLL